MAKLRPLPPPPPGFTEEVSLTSELPPLNAPIPPPPPGFTEEVVRPPEEFVGPPAPEPVSIPSMAEGRTGPPPIQAGVSRRPKPVELFGHIGGGGLPRVERPVYARRRPQVPLRDEPQIQRFEGIGDEALIDRIKASSAILEVSTDPDFEHMLPEVRTLFYNKARRERGLPEADHFPKPVTAGEFAREELFTGRGVGTRIPFIGAGVEATELVDVWTAAQRMAALPEGSDPDRGDLETLTRFYERLAHESRGRTIPGLASKILSDSIPFMTEFLVSGGLISGVKKLGKETAVKATKEVVEKTLFKALGRIARRTAVGTVQRFPFFTPRVGREAVRRMLPATELDAYGDDGFQFAVLAPGEPWWEAVPKASVDVAIEIFSEQTGEALGLFFRPITTALKKTGAPNLVRVEIKDFLAKMGYHGILEEVGEERVGELMRALGSYVGVTDPQKWPTMEQLVAETMAFSVPAVGGAAVSTGLQRTQRLAERRAGEEGVARPLPAAGELEAERPPLPGPRAVRRERALRQEPPRPVIGRRPTQQKPGPRTRTPRVEIGRPLPAEGEPEHPEAPTVMDEVLETPVEIGRPLPAAPPEVAQERTKSTLRRNPERGGVEVAFSEKPPRSVLSDLRDMGFKWSKRQKLWYAPFAPDRWEKANALLESHEGAQGSVIAPEPVTEPLPPAEQQTPTAESAAERPPQLPKQGNLAVDFVRRANSLAGLKKLSVSRLRDPDNGVVRLAGANLAEAAKWARGMAEADWEEPHLASNYRKIASVLEQQVAAPALPETPEAPIIPARGPTQEVYDRVGDVKLDGKTLQEAAASLVRRHSELADQIKAVAARKTHLAQESIGPAIRAVQRTRDGKPLVKEYEQITKDIVALENRYMTEAQRQVEEPGAPTGVSKSGAASRRVTPSETPPTKPLPPAEPEAERKPKSPKALPKAAEPLAQAEEQAKRDFKKAVDDADSTVASGPIPPHIVRVIVTGSKLAAIKMVRFGLSVSRAIQSGLAELGYSLSSLPSSIIFKIRGYTMRLVAAIKGGYFEREARKIERENRPRGINTKMSQSNFRRMMEAARHRLERYVKFPDPPMVRDAVKPISEKTQKLIASHARALKPSRTRAETAKHIERVRRVGRMRTVLRGPGGAERRLISAMGEMAGPLFRPYFEPLGPKLTPEQRAETFDHIDTHRWLQGYPLTQSAFARMWAAVLDYGHLPTEGEIGQIERFFGAKVAAPFMVHAARASRGGLWKLFARSWIELSGISRGVKAGFDHSNMLRQSVLLTSAYPVKALRAFWKSARAGYGDTFGALGSALARGYRLRAAIRIHASERYARKSDRYMHFGPKAKEWDLVGLDRIRLDAELSPKWTERMQETHSRFWDLVVRAQGQTPLARAALAPLKTVAAGVRASNRLFAVYSNELRTSVYEEIVRSLPSPGQEARDIFAREIVKIRQEIERSEREDNEGAVRIARAELDEVKAEAKRPAIERRKELAQFLNVTTGRSTTQLGRLASGRFPSAVFWSLRLQASRIESVFDQLPRALFSPTTPWPTRKLAIREITGTALLTLGVFGALKLLFDSVGDDDDPKRRVEIETDPRSSDFLKVRAGDTTLNVPGGYQEPLRLVAQLLFRERKQFRSGKIVPTRWADTIVMWVRYKLEPVGSALWAAFENKNAIGDIETVPQQFRDLFAPITLEQAVEAIQADGILGSFWSVPEQLGTSVAVRSLDVERQVDDLHLWMRKLSDPGFLDPIMAYRRRHSDTPDDETLQRRYDAQVGAYRSAWYDELWSSFEDGDRLFVGGAAKALVRLGVTRDGARQSALGRKVIEKGRRIPVDVNLLLRSFPVRRSADAIPEEFRDFLGVEKTAATGSQAPGWWNTPLPPE